MDVLNCLKGFYIVNSGIKTGRKERNGVKLPFKREEKNGIDCSEIWG